MLKVLIAEDDLMIADLIEETLIEHGYAVCGIARTVAEAVALVQEHRPDLAVIDMRLADGGFGTEIAETLGGLNGMGILYATGNTMQVLLADADGHASLLKPYRTNDLLRGLEIVADIVASGQAQPPFPRGFQLLNRATDASETIDGR